jgi:hypothetical protein
MTEELYQFVVCDYSATGERRTICLLITRAYPYSEDYTKQSKFDEQGNWQFCPETKNTAQERAMREFTVKFGGWMSHGAEIVDRKAFLERFGHMLPTPVKNMLETTAYPGNMNFAQEFHINFS